MSQSSEGSFDPASQDEAAKAFFAGRIVPSDIILDSAARAEYVRGKHFLRSDLKRRPFVQIAQPEDREVETKRFWFRRSDRQYLDEPISFDRFSAFLSLLREEQFPTGTKRRYGSAGSTYPVQVYVHVHDGKVEGVSQGLYWYHPVANRLVVLSDGPALDRALHFPTNDAWAANASTTLFLVGDTRAIAPLYGGMSRDFMFIEAGLIAQLLETEGPPLGIGLCQVGAVNFDLLRKTLELTDEHEFIYTIVCGAVPPRYTPNGVTAGAGVELHGGNGNGALAHPENGTKHVNRALDPVCLAEIERDLSVLWCESLGFDTIDVHAQFFDMGGTSLQTARIAAELQDKYPCQLDVADLFSHATIHDLARLITERLGRFVEPAPNASSAEICIEMRPSRAAVPLARQTGGIAIVGMAARLPGAPDLESFWRNLEGGVSSTGPLPDHRARLVPLFQPNSEQVYRGGYIDDVDKFDPLFFHISPKEARRMDPAQRLLLETCYEAVERAGYAGRLHGTRTGLFVGAGASEYWRLLQSLGDQQDLTRLLTGNMPAILANRVSHFLDFRGPSVAVDTACSSSLVAVDMACRSILSGDSEAAVVASVNLLLAPGGFEAFRQDGMESAGGCCHTFDRLADGFIRGEGVGAIVLKPLATAQRDGDTILAVIIGSATNHDGNTNSVSVPNPVTQQEAVLLAQERAGVTADTISYIEAHGTGTSLGDPIEISGLTQAFRRTSSAKSFCAIGSVKSNIGHLEYTAGIAGLIKTVLALRHKRLPPSLHFQSPNPHIDFANSPFYVVDRARAWPAGAEPRRAGVSSFGVGGTNAHVIVEEAPTAVESPSWVTTPPHVFVLSARDDDALVRLAERYLGYLNGIDVAPLHDVCFTAGTGRAVQGTRLAIVAADLEQLCDKLSIYFLSGGKRDLWASRVYCGGTRGPNPLTDEERQRLARITCDLDAKGVERIRTWCKGSLFERHIAPLIATADILMSSQVEDCKALYCVLAHLFCLGVDVDWDAVYAERPGRRVPLPTYPFASESIWVEYARSAPANEAASMRAPLLAPWQYEVRIDSADPRLAHHRVSGASVFPGAGYLDLATLAVEASVGSPIRRMLDVSFHRAMIAPEGQPIWIQVLAEPDARGYTLRFLGTTHAPEHAGERVWMDIASLVADTNSVPCQPANGNLATATERCSESLRRADVYAWFESLGITYGPAFQSLDRIRRGAGEVVATVDASGFGALKTGYLHPSLIDGALQALGCISYGRSGSVDGVYVPRHIDEITVVAPLGQSAHVHGCGTEAPSKLLAEARGDVSLMDDSGRILVELRGIGYARISRAPVAQQSSAPRTLSGRQLSEVEMKAFLIESVSKALEMPKDWVQIDHPLIEMGMDSVTAVALIDELSRYTREPLPATFFFEHPTIAGLAQALVSEHHVCVPMELETPHSTDDLPPPQLDVDRAPAITVAPIAQPAATVSDPEDRAIAVIGMAGRFPAAPNLEALWRNLENGVDGVTEIPRERWDWERYFDPDPNALGKMYGKWGGFIDDIDLFDPTLFRISAREARSIGPQQRHLLEVTHQLLETAGYGGKALFGSQTGVFVGSNQNHLAYELMRRYGNEPTDPHLSLGLNNGIQPGRISFAFDLRGPSVTIDTLCSGALVAVHTAMRALRNGECEYAIVASAHLGPSPLYYETLSRLRALSALGRCRTFDRRADGYTPGEGVAAVLLRPLKAAREAGDQILAILRGGAVNHGGQSSGLTVPNPVAQSEVIRAALADAGVSPRDISYVEVHGTGTRLGDPIEVAGLCRAYAGSGVAPQSCALGTIKSNIGHQEQLAGLAGLIKVVLSLKARQLPPSLHVREPNPQILFEDSPFYVVDRLTPWKDRGGKRRAGVSSFGLGGTNAHVIVEEAPQRSAIDARVKHPNQLLTISAQTEPILEKAISRYIDFLGHTTEELGDICFTAAVGREHMLHRLAIIAESRDELREKLRAVIDDSSPNERRVFKGARRQDKSLTAEELNDVRREVACMQPAARAEFEQCLRGQLRDRIVGPDTAPHGTSVPATFERDDRGRLLELLGRLYVLGADIDWPRVYARSDGQRVALPLYPAHRVAFPTKLRDMPASDADAARTNTATSPGTARPLIEASAPETPDGTHAPHPLLGMAVMRRDGTGTVFDSEFLLTP